jgi:hypothetical protein
VNVINEFPAHRRVHQDVRNGGDADVITFAVAWRVAVALNHGIDGHNLALERGHELAVVTHRAPPFCSNQRSMALRDQRNAPPLPNGNGAGNNLARTYLLIVAGLSSNRSDKRRMSKTSDVDVDADMKSSESG